MWRKILLIKSRLSSLFHLLYNTSVKANFWRSNLTQNWELSQNSELVGWTQNPRAELSWDEGASVSSLQISRMFVPLFFKVSDIVYNIYITPVWVMSTMILYGPGCQGTWISSLVLVLQQWTMKHHSDHTVLYCTILYCTVVYYTVLYYTVCHTVFYWLYCIVLYCIILYCHFCQYSIVSIVHSV